MEQNEIKYKDMINLPHPVSKKHPHMSIQDRAAQFAPFAALTGYEDAVRETSRVTNNRKELAEEEINQLNQKLWILQQKIQEHPKVQIIYFEPDLYKTGGEYITITKRVIQIRQDTKQIILEDHSIIPMKEILELSGEYLEE